MNCQFPVNIKKDEALNCSNNCSFKFDYGQTPSFKVKLTPGNLLFQVTNSDETVNVFFNKQKIKPSSMMINKGSFLLYDGSHAEAELIISHYRERLHIVVPIKIDDNAGRRSNRFFNQILSNISFNMNEDYQSILTNNVSINDIVPTGEFYYFECRGEKLIVYHKDTNPITINQHDFNKLNNLIKNKIDYTSARWGTGFIDKIKDTRGYSKVIVYRNGPDREGFVSSISNTLGLTKQREGLTNAEGAVGPDSDNNYTYSNCEYQGTIENDIPEKATNDTLESIRWWAITMFIALIALLTAILIYFSLSSYNSGGYDSLSEARGSGIDAQS